MRRRGDASSPTHVPLRVGRGSAFTITIVVGTCFIGCSQHSGKLSVSGTVSVDGVPLADGSINFQPAEGSTGNTAGAIIRDGAFQVAAAAGLQPGNYVVRVAAERPTGRTVVDPQRGEVPLLAPIDFEDFDRAVTISSNGENVLDFNLKSTASG